MKGKLEDGSDAPEDDFLARNGFKYGQLYGFATDMSETGPTGGVGRDEWHKTATNGAEVVGKMIAQPWRWDGEVRNFEHDGKAMLMCKNAFYHSCKCKCFSSLEFIRCVGLPKPTSGLWRRWHGEL